MIRHPLNPSPRTDPPVPDRLTRSLADGPVRVRDSRAAATDAPRCPVCERLGADLAAIKDSVAALVEDVAGIRARLDNEL